MDRSTLLRRAPLGALAALIVSLPAAAQCGASKLGGAAPMAGDELGARLALSGSTALVGAPRDDGAALDAGAVDVLQLASGSWTRIATLTAPDAAPGRLFGAAVALDGARGVVGAPAWASTDAHPGSAYLLADGPGGWSVVETLAPTDPQPGRQFGYAVAILGDTVLVGAPADGQLGPSAGAAYVFELGPAGWTQIAKLTAAGGLAQHRFGRAVALDGDTALVGSLGGGPVEWAGAVHVFERTPLGWMQVDVLFPSESWPGDELGAALDLDGDRALVGSPGRSVSFFEQGAAFVFERAGGAWTQTAMLVTGSGYQPFTSDHLGASVALEGDRVLAGGPGFDGGEGAAVSWHHTGSSWQTEAKWKAYDAPHGADFGSAVGFTGEVALIGAPGDDAAATDAGAVYGLEYPLAGCPPLFGAPEALSLATGGTQHLTLAPSVGYAMHTWFLLGSASGTSPGIAGPGGLVLPLNPGPYLTHTLLHPNTPPLPKSVSSFGYGYSDAATFELPAGLPPALSGVTLHHAYVIIDPWTSALVMVSNAAPVMLQ